MRQVHVQVTLINRYTTGLPDHDAIFYVKTAGMGNTEDDIEQ